MLIYCICTQYLVGAPFALITAQFGVAWRWSVFGTAEVVWNPRFLWQWPSGHLHFLVALFSHFPLDKPHRFSMGFRSGEFAGQSSTPTPWSSFGAFGSVGRCQILLENEISKRKHEVLQKFLVTGAVTLVFKKTHGPTPADDIAPQIITDCGNLTLDFMQLGLWASPPVLQTLGPWFPMKYKTCSHLKEDFGPLGKQSSSSSH